MWCCYHYVAGLGWVWCTRSLGNPKTVVNKIFSDGLFILCLELSVVFFLCFEWEEAEGTVRYAERELNNVIFLFIYICGWVGVFRSSSWYFYLLSKKKTSPFHLCRGVYKPEEHLPFTDVFLFEKWKLKISQPGGVFSSVVSCNQCSSLGYFRDMANKFSVFILLPFLGAVGPLAFIYLFLLFFRRAVGPLPFTLFSIDVHPRWDPVCILRHVEHSRERFCIMVALWVRRFE